MLRNGYGLIKEETKVFDAMFYNLKSEDVVAAIKRTDGGSLSIKGKYITCTLCSTNTRPAGGGSCCYNTISSCLREQSSPNERVIAIL